MASQKEELSLLDAFLNMSRNATGSESGAASLTEFGEMAQQGKLQPQQFQSERMAGDPKVSPFAVMKQIGAEAFGAAAEKVNEVVKQAALGRKNLARAAAKALMGDFPSVAGDMMNDISSFSPYNNTVRIYADQYKVGIEELKMAVREMAGSDSTPTPTPTPTATPEPNPLLAKKEADVKYLKGQLSKKELEAVSALVSQPTPTATATAAGGPAIPAVTGQAMRDVSLTPGQEQYLAAHGMEAGDLVGPFVQYDDPQDAAFTSMVYSTLGPVKAGNARVMEAAKRGKYFSQGHFLLASAGGKSAQEQKLDPDWTYPKFLEGRKPSEFMGSPVTEEAYQDFLQGSKRVYDNDPNWHEGSGIGPVKAKYIGGVVEYPAHEFSIVAAREGITGRGLIGKMRLESLGKTYKYWQNEQIRAPGSPRRGFIAFWDELKGKRGESQQVRQAQQQ
jgi:hypothetical protein